MKFSVLLIQSKLPGATAAIIGNIRIAAKTFASNAFIYCFSKTAIFNYTYRFTRMILHLFFVCGLFAHDIQACDTPKFYCLSPE